MRLGEGLWKKKTFLRLLYSKKVDIIMKKDFMFSFYSKTSFLFKQY
jgi:hypothetical protein